MNWRYLKVLAFCVSLSGGFKDTSPFFLFSTSELLISAPNLVTASSLQKSTSSQLETCPSDAYVIVSQPGVNAVDFHDRKSMPNLARWVAGEDKSIRSSFAAQDVKGSVSSVELKDLLEIKCKAEHVRQDASTGSISIGDESNPRVLNLEFPSPPTGAGRKAALAEHDGILSRLIDMLPSDKFTVIYTTTPSNASPQHGHVEPELYEMESTLHGHSHIELKRDLGLHKRQSSDESLPDGPLFERYQFLSPGLFMGLLAGIILLLILYVAVSGVSSLQVTYAAFDKEIGPAAQKNRA